MIANVMVLPTEWVTRMNNQKSLSLSVSVVYVY